MTTNTMRGHELIDAYLAELSRTLRGQPDADDLVAELADHLCESVDGAVARGSDAVIAQQVAIARLGQPALVATALVSARARRLAQPSNFTVAAGRLGAAAAVLWVILGAAEFVASEVVLDLPDGSARQLIFATGMAAILATALLIMGISVRSGGRRDIKTLSVAVCGVLALVGGAGMQWFFILWGGFLSIAALIANRQRLRVATGSPSSLSLSLAWPVGTVVVLVGQALHWGPMGFYEDYPLAIATGVAVGCALCAIGCAVNARWLAGETVAISDLATA